MAYGYEHLQVKNKGIVCALCNSSTMRFFFFSLSCGSVSILLFFVLFGWFGFRFDLNYFVLQGSLQGKRASARSERWVLSGYMMWNCKESINVYKMN